MLRSMRRSAHRTGAGALRGTDPARTWRAGARLEFWRKPPVLHKNPDDKGLRAFPTRVYGLDQLGAGLPVTSSGSQEMRSFATSVRLESDPAAVR